MSVDNYDPLRESGVESKFALTNGFLGIGGARSTSRGERRVIPARAYVAGPFDGAEHAPTEHVPAADWLRIRFLVVGSPLQHHPGAMASPNMALDMRREAVLSAGRHSHTPNISFGIQTSRHVSIDNRALTLRGVFSDGSPAVRSSDYINLKDYSGRSGPMNLVLGRMRTQQSQIRECVIKQADVVDVLGLLPEEFAGNSLAKNSTTMSRDAATIIH